MFESASLERKAGGYMLLINRLFYAAKALDAAQVAGPYRLVDHINDLRSREGHTPRQGHGAAGRRIAEATYAQQAL